MRRKLKVSVIATMAVLNVAVIIMMAVVGYAGRWSPEVHPVRAAMTLTFPAFLVLNLLFLVAWLFVRKRWAVLPVVGLFVCGGPTRSYCPINIGGNSDTTGAIKVLTYNMGGFNGGDGFGTVIDSQEIINYLVEAEADIICLQEATLDSTSSRLRKLLKPRLPYYSYGAKGAGDCVALYSRFPIVDAVQVEYESRGNLSVAFLLRVDKRPMIVINNHLETNHLSLSDRASFKGIVRGEVSASKAEDESRTLLRKVSHSGSLRAPQADSVRRFYEHYLKKPVDIIVCGDFNDNPLSYSVRTIGEGLTDCFVASGNGPGWSYHKNGMYVRIDHMFCSDGLEPIGAKVDTKIGASDHYPLYCWLKKRVKD